MSGELLGPNGEQEKPAIWSFLRPSKILQGIKEVIAVTREDIQDIRRESWENLNGMPYLDRGSPVSLAPSADGPIATLARLELNHRKHRPLDEGIEDSFDENGNIKPGAP